MQSSAFRVLSCLCFLSHDFGITPTLRLSALDEQNADIPGLFQSINAPFGPWLTVLSQQNLWIRCIWLPLGCCCFSVPGCGYVVRLSRGFWGILEKIPTFFSDHIWERKSNSTSLEHTALCQKVENLVLNSWGNFSSFNLKKKEPLLKCQVTLNTYWEFGWYNGITVRMNTPKILCPSEKDY